MAQPEKSTTSLMTSRAEALRPSLREVARSPRAQRIALGLGLIALIQLAGGILLTPQGSLLVIGPISLFALPILAALADFAVPQLGERQRRWQAGAIMVAIIVGGGIGLTVLAQAVVGHVDLVGVFSADPRQSAGHLTTFPFTIPLGALIFVIYLEVAIVSGVPLVTTQTQRVRDGVLALAGSIVAGLILYQLLANWASVPAVARNAIGLRNPGGPVDALDLAGMLISIAIWQVVYLFLGGWGLQTIRQPWQRLAASNGVVIGFGLATYWLLRAVFGAAVPQIAVLAAMLVAGMLVVGILFGMPAAAPPRQHMPALQRLYRLCEAGVAALIVFVVLRWLGTTLQPQWTAGSLELWMAICALNFVAGGTMLYCRILLPVWR